APPSAVAGAHHHNMAQSSSAAVAIMGAPDQRHAWSLATSSSPVESCFTSGSSTPSFASLSPSLSYSNSELCGNDSTSSCNSSRPTSPLFNQPGSPYESFLLSERGLGRLEKDTSSLIIRSRKSSTSSTSSNISQRRMSSLRESVTAIHSSNSNSSGSSNNSNSSNPSSPITSSPSITTTSPTHQCPKCGQNFAGPAVLIRHIESIHDKLLWNCVGCKSNLSRRDAVTRHINLSPMDSICRAIGTIGQIKMINGTEIQYEVSSYRAKPLDEVMSRMGKKIPTALRREIDLAKALGAGEHGGAVVFGSAAGDLMVGNGMYGLETAAAAVANMTTMEIFQNATVTGFADAYVMDFHHLREEYGEDEGGLKKRRRASQPSLGQRKK
ncbi:hypothetical protein EDD11_001877, partial [Mortierella claussenii]